MIKRKLKICRICKKEAYLFSQGRCASCTAKETPKKPYKGSITRVSATQKVRNEKYAALRLKWLESHPRCAVFPELLSCEIHHIEGRIGDNMFKHFLAVSVEGHRWIHANVDKAREKGWIK